MFTFIYFYNNKRRAKQVVVSNLVSHNCCNATQSYNRKNLRVNYGERHHFFLTELLNCEVKWGLASRPGVVGAEESREFHHIDARRRLLSGSRAPRDRWCPVPRPLATLGNQASREMPSPNLPSHKWVHVDNVLQSMRPKSSHHTGQRKIHPIS